MASTAGEMPEHSDGVANTGTAPVQGQKLPRAATFTVPKMKIPRGMTFRGVSKEPRSVPAQDWLKYGMSSRADGSSHPSSAPNTPSAHNIEAQAGPFSPGGKPRLPRGMTQIFFSSQGTSPKSVKSSVTTGRQMKAVVGKGALDVPLRTWQWLAEDIVFPEERAGCVIIKVSAVGLRRQDMSDVFFYKAVADLGGGTIPDRYTVGTDVAGIIHEIGPKVRGWKVGDQVLAYTVPGGGGGCQQYVSVDESHVFRKPNSLSMIETAAVLTDGLLAFRAIKSAEKYLSAGDGSVVISGAATKEGIILSQAVKYLFGSRVTAICKDRNAAAVLEMMDVDEIVDLTDNPAAADKFARTFDVAFDTSGTLDDVIETVKRGGIIVSTDGTPPAELLRGAWYPSDLKILVKQIQDRDEQKLFKAGVFREFVFPEYSSLTIKHLLAMVEKEEIDAACGPTYGLQKCTDAVRAARLTTTGKVIICFD